MKIEKLKEGNAGIRDPRRTACGGEDFVDMEKFGKARENFLRKFLELPNGIPDSDTFRACLVFRCAQNALNLASELLRIFRQTTATGCCRSRNKGANRTFAPKATGGNLAQ